MCVDCKQFKVYFQMSLMQLKSTHSDNVQGVFQQQKTKTKKKQEIILNMVVDYLVSFLMDIYRMI